MNSLDALPRRALYLGCAVLFITGSIWAVLRYLAVQVGLEERAAMAGADFAMKVHGAAAMLALVLIGTLLPRHVSHGMKNARNKPSGIGMLSFFGVLSVSGYFLYYAGSDELRSVNSWIHLVVGLALPGIVLAHVVCRLPRARAALAAGNAR